jgi:hypothetical protein
MSLYEYSIFGFVRRTELFTVNCELSMEPGLTTLAFNFMRKTCFHWFEQFPKGN